MKNKKSDLLTVGLFCAFLFVILLFYIFQPKKSFSEEEKRYLAQAPALSWAAVSSGDWGDDAETYMADHIPGRSFFVGLNAYFELFTGRQVSKDIWVADGRLIEAPVTYDEAAARRNMAALNAFAEAVDQTVELAIVPSAGWAGGTEGYPDVAVIDGIYAMAGDKLEAVDLLSVLEGQPQLFYRTDHHWTSEGAHTAYRVLMDKLGRDSAPAEAFEKTAVSGFHGSTYSRSALWLTPAEELELWRGSGALTVCNGESEEDHDGVFYPERLEEADKYTVFLDGNHSTVRIRNPEAEGKLLVIRDSFSNCLGCFLAESYGEVLLVDLRYYKLPVSALVAQEGFDDILVCYSIGNFLTDVNIVFLR